MDKLKRILVMMLAVVFALALAGCGGSEDEGEEASKEAIPCYIADSMKTGEAEASGDDLKKEMRVDDLSELMTIYLAPDGTAVVGGQNGVYSGKWTQKDDDITVSAKIDGKTQKPVFHVEDEDTLTVKDKAGSSEMTLTLKRTDEIPEIISKDIMKFFTVDFDMDQSCRMNTAVLGGSYCFDGDKIYGHFFDKDNNACLGKAAVGEGTQLKDKKVLDEGCVPTSIVKSGDTLYYTRHDLEDDEKYELCRINTDGSSKETLYEGKCSDITVRDEKLYYADKENHYVCADLDGGNSTPVLDKEVYYTYWINDNWLIYQDDADGETLHLYFVPLGKDKKITEAASYCPVIDGNVLWYVEDKEGEGKDYRLARLDLTTLKSESGENSWPGAALEVLKDYVYMGGYNDNPNAGVVKKTWKHGEDVAAVDWEKYPWTEQKAISNKGDYRVEWQNEGNGIQIWFFNKDQGQGVSFK